MKDVILEYIIKEFGNSRGNKHYDYCSFPEDDCSCKDLQEITYDTELITGGYMDSFSMVRVLVFIEQTFDVKIPNNEATPSNFNTINLMMALYDRHK